MEEKGAINQYVCDFCLCAITTINLEDGVTPFMLPCLATFGCKGTMQSRVYRVLQDLAPTHEWYKPADLASLKGWELEHVTKGGLLLRAIPGFEPVIPTKERLARELEALSDPTLYGIIKRARAGYYDDFECEIATPQIQLVNDLRKHGPAAQAFTRRVIDGEFDATTEESEAWASRSGVGEIEMGELLGFLSKLRPRDGGSHVR